MSSWGRWMIRRGPQVCSAVNRNGSCMAIYQSHATPQSLHTRGRPLLPAHHVVYPFSGSSSTIPSGSLRYTPIHVVCNYLSSAIAPWVLFGLQRPSGIMAVAMLRSWTEGSPREGETNCQCPMLHVRVPHLIFTGHYRGRRPIDRAVLYDFARPRR